MSPGTRISDLELGMIDLRLTERDRRILRTIQRFRFVRTNQVQRLFFRKPSSTPRARLTSTTKLLHRLESKGLIAHLDRKLGGIGTGNYGLVWYLTNAGSRLLDHASGTPHKRVNRPQPSLIFLRHTLAVVECFVQIVEICRQEHNMDYRELEIEPQCWRAYQKSGIQYSLRPDLYAETISGEYVDRWFIEMDLSTEGLQTIIEKCRRYHDYYQIVRDQDPKEVFPIVLWLVPDTYRKENIIEVIKETFGNRYRKIFLVITPEELHQTLRDGAEQEALC